MSIASSPPLDLDPGDFVSEESVQEHMVRPGMNGAIGKIVHVVFLFQETTAEFTKVTKKQRKKKGRERGTRFPPGSVFRYVGLFLKVVGPPTIFNLSLPQ